MARRHLLILAVLAGCSAGTAQEQSSSWDGGEDVRAATADGEVTLAEYDAGFFRFRDCLAADGYEIVDIVFNAEVQLWEYFVPDGAYESGSGDRCYEAEFGALDMGWQLSPARPKPEYQTLSGEQVITECLEAAGATVDTSYTIDELDAMLPHYGLTVNDCVELAQRQHP